MPDPTHRSSRFLQAARSELKRLGRKRSQLSRKREDLQARLDSLDAELEAVDREIVVLDGLATEDVAPPNVDARSNGDEQSPDHDDDRETLKGGRIRELALPVLLRERGTGPIHYREWLRLLEDQGFQVAGKRPEAVFLNQIVRSPLVRATTQAGFYEVDLDAPAHLRARLRTEQRELAAHIQFAPQHDEALGQHRGRQRELNVAISKTQRELDEALGVLDAAGRQTDTSAARAA